MSECKFKSYIAEIDNVDRPCMIILRSDTTGIIAYYKNQAFERLKKFEIDTDRLLNSLSFTKYCQELLNCKSFTTSDRQFNLGKQRRVVELYGTARRTGQAGYLDPYQSDLLIVQVNIQELVTTDRMFDTPKQLHNAHEDVLRQIAHIYKEIDELEAQQIHQKYINQATEKTIEKNDKDFEKIKALIESNKLLRMTQNLTLADLVKIISAFFLALSLLDLAEKPISQSTKETIQSIKELLD